MLRGGTVIVNYKTRISLQDLVTEMGQKKIISGNEGESFHLHPSPILPLNLDFQPYGYLQALNSTGCFLLVDLYSYCSSTETSLLHLVFWTNSWSSSRLSFENHVLSFHRVSIHIPTMTTQLLAELATSYCAPTAPIMSVRSLITMYCHYLTLSSSLYYQARQ